MEFIRKQALFDGGDLLLQDLPLGWRKVRGYSDAALQLQRVAQDGHQRIAREACQGPMHVVIHACT